MVEKMINTTYKTARALLSFIEESKSRLNIYISGRAVVCEVKIVNFMKIKRKSLMRTEQNIEQLLTKAIKPLKAENTRQLLNETT